MDEQLMEFEFSNALRLSIKVHATSGPADRSVFSVEEIEALKHARQNESYLRGRTALKTILRRLEMNVTVDSLKFPHKQISLTHSGDCAVAVGTAEPVLGIGIDFEMMKPVKSAMSRFFLTKSELIWIDEISVSEQATELLRLWTVKEALFKSDPENRNRTLKSYCLLEPKTLTGQAFISGNRKTELRYSSLKLESEFEGYLSVAARLY